MNRTDELADIDGRLIKIRQVDDLVAGRWTFFSGYVYIGIYRKIYWFYSIINIQMNSQ